MPASLSSTYVGNLIIQSSPSISVRIFGLAPPLVPPKLYSSSIFSEYSVFNILLQVLDDGHITDAQGRKVDFKNTIIILTSNLGSPYILEGIDEKTGAISSDARAKVDALLKQSFRPEFLNRLDEIVFYKPLTKTEVGKIVDLMLQDLERRLDQKQLHLTVSDAAKDAVVAQGYDVNYGARPLKRFIQQKIETLIAKLLIAQDPLPDSTIVIDYTGTQFTANLK